MKIHRNIDRITSVIHDHVTVDFYLIKGQRVVLIDTGIFKSPETDLLPVLAENGLSTSDLEMIMHTHGHPDHVGGNEYIQFRSDAKVAIHENDALYLGEPEGSFDVFIKPVISALGGDVESEKRMFFGMAGAVYVPDRILRDGDTVDCGGGIVLKVVHLPGHTLGSVGYFWEAEGILFCGDAVPGLHSERGKLPIIIDLKAYQSSLKRLQGMGIRCLLCSHAYSGTSLPPAAIREGRDVATYLAESLEFAERLYDATMGAFPYRNEMSFVELADQIILNLPEKFGIQPLSETKMPMITPQSFFFTLYGIPSP